jgi:hypothetical protein
VAVTAKQYPQFQQKALTKLVNVSSDPLILVLLTAYTFSLTHATLADVLAAGTEASGTSYTAGGVTVAGQLLTTSGSVTTLTATSPNLSTSTVTASYGVWLIKPSGASNSTTYPVCYWDFGGSQSSNTGNFTLTINASGLATWTVS